MPNKPYVKMTFDDKYHCAKDSRGYYVHDLFFGIDGTDLYYQSGGGGGTQFYQNETLGYSTNTPLQSNMQQHLTKVDCIETKAEYLDQAMMEQLLSGNKKGINTLWFSILVKEKPWDRVRLYRTFKWDPDTKLITYGNEYGAGKKTCTLDEIIHLYYPHPNIEELNKNKAVELLRRAALIIDENNEEASNRGEYSNINIVRDINKFLENEEGE